MSNGVVLILSNDICKQTFHSIWIRLEEVEDLPTATREHLEWCQGYAFLRAGRDLYIERDRTRYFMDVMRMRGCKV